MRLRSSHFVFLVLLLCSVQLREDVRLQLAGGAIANRSPGKAPRGETASAAARPLPAQAPGTGVIELSADLDPASRSAHRASWPMREPSSDAAAISTCTGLLRS